MKDFAYSRWFHLLVLLIWIAVGTGFRFAQLTAKPPWTDEFATLVFSLGHSFTTVPLDAPISLEELMQPLQPSPAADSNAVIHYLFAEDVHPPFYFVVAHWWMRLFAPENGLVSLWGARSLPALLGVVSIPAMFGLGWLAFRSLLIGHSMAAIMAVSPFAIYLAQEARHYTLAILWVIGCLCCLCFTVQAVQRRSPVPVWVGGLWIGVNALGLATHHFFLLTLCAAALVLLGFGVVQFRDDRAALWRSPWRRVYAIGIGTAVSSLIWIPLWQNIRSHDITQWIQSDERFNFLSLLNPIVQSLAAWITMLVLLPVESSSIFVVILAGLAMGLFLIWVVPLLWQGLRSQRSQPQVGLGIQVLAGFSLGAIALFFLITYGLGTDLTRGARYNFVYFPAVVGLLGIGLAALLTHWSAVRPTLTAAEAPLQPRSAASNPDANRGLKLPTGFNWRGIKQAAYPKDGRVAVLVVWAIGCLSSLTVVANLGYQKYYRPDLLLPLIQNQSSVPVLIATTHNTLVQVGEMMGIGWQVLQRQNSTAANAAMASRLQVQFLLAHQPQAVCMQDCVATETLETAIAESSTPLDVWLVNFQAPASSVDARCVLDSAPSLYVSGYGYQLYHCREGDR
ncbi:glycosyltransferase family 39 protein [Oculatella sp. LEGE 06141]|uniref:glycosyltransferase family 39 protein n=1 Tax=Oculatella sp. LEGE 06141 TaxID=1828648 RepID=UPI001D148F1F|nr:hypothetical protein [Oculatella sp. LEGE 06141]